MLQSLTIRDYALIEELEIEFTRGLNIITGETGAGKSILIGGLKLILGGRANTDALRAGAQKAVVEGVFFIGDHAAIREVLAEEGFDVHDELILRREVREKQSRAFINDSPASLAQMRRVAAELIDLHGQHEHQSLMKSDRHLSMVDMSGGYADLLGEYRIVFGRVRVLHEERSALKKREHDVKERRELLAFQIEEIDAIDPHADENAHLEGERRVIENAEVLFNATHSLFEQLYDSDQSVLGVIVNARNELRNLSRLDSSFSELADELEAARISIDEASKSIHDYNQNIEFNPSRLESIRERMGDLDTLCRRYGGSIQAVLDRRQTIGEEYAVASDFEATTSRIEEELEQKQRLLTDLAWRISAERIQRAGVIEKQVREQLRELGMPDARFEIRISQESDESGWVCENCEEDGGSVSHYRARLQGVDRVSFFLSANRGEELRPLERIASGGEISRIMLALKSVLAHSGGIPVLVFDEIDAGISGGIAQRVGEQLQHLAEDHQLLVITHLPQVAARAHSHFRVEKRLESGRTLTIVSRLDDNERQKEIATLLSGKTVTDAALEGARELIKARF